MKNRKNDIERYLRGELSPTEMHALEKEALNDPFLAEALEGAEQTGPGNFLYDLHALNRSLHRRARTRKNKTIKMWGWTAAIAATVLLIAVSGFLVVSLIRDQHARQQAMNREASFPDKNEPAKDTLTIAMPLDRRSIAAKRSKDSAKDNRARRKTETLEQSGPAGQEKAPGHPLSDDQRFLAENDVKTPVKEETTKPEVTEDAVRMDIPETVVAADKQKEAEKITEARELQQSEALSKAATEKSDKMRRETGEKTAQVPAVSQSAPDRTIVLKGQVVSADDGEGLPGVNVIVQGTDHGTVTDAQGNYQLDVPALNSKLLFSFIGFQTKEVDVAGKPEVNIQLEADADQLSEVVVTAYGNASNETIEDAAAFHIAEPDGGKTKFRKYLLESVRYPEEALANKVEGKVTIRFSVQPDGKLTDFEVIKGLGRGCDEELIRLIRQGPPWKPATQGDRPVADKVKVRFKFQLPG